MSTKPNFYELVAKNRDGEIILLTCPKCGETHDDQAFDVCGADDGCVFCPSCGDEVVYFEARVAATEKWGGPSPEKRELTLRDLRRLLDAIRQSKGPYLRDRLQHAHNIIDRAERLAEAGMEAIDANDPNIITEALDNDD